MSASDVKRDTSKSKSVVKAERHVKAEASLPSKYMSRIKARGYVKRKKSIVLPLVFKCELCNKTFGTANRCYKHLRTHSKGCYGCAKCRKRFQYPKILPNHQMMHNKKLYLKCDVPGCTKKYPTQESLKYHMSTYQGFRFKCTRCKFKTTTKANLHQQQTGAHDISLKAKCGQLFRWPYQGRKTKQSARNVELLRQGS